MKENRIYWSRDSFQYQVSIEELFEKIEWYKENGRIASDKYKMSAWDTKAYRIDSKGNWITLYCSENLQWTRYTANKVDEKKRLDKNTGAESLRIIKNEFKKRNHTTFVKAFGTVEAPFKAYIPKQLYWQSKLYKKNRRYIASKIDGCSQYPSNVRGALPDRHTALVVHEKVLPNEEYRFAFYPDTGHIAEYGVFDTHDWIKYEDMKENLFYDIYKASGTDSRTILMKASKYELTDTMQYFFDRKEQFPKDTAEYDEAKLVINSGIGEMHTQKYKRDKYAHLAAVAIARANDSVLKKMKEVGWSNVIQVIVDGIIYEGDTVYGEEKKRIGVYHQELLGEQFGQMKTNQYVFEGKEAVHSSYNWNTRKNRPIDDTDTIEDMKFWARKEKESIAKIEKYIKEIKEMEKK